MHIRIREEKKMMLNFLDVKSDFWSRRWKSDSSTVLLTSIYFDMSNCYLTNSMNHFV